MVFAKLNEEKSDIYSEYKLPTKVLHIDPFKNPSGFKAQNFNENLLKSIKKVIVIFEQHVYKKRSFKILEKLKDFKNLQCVWYERVYHLDMDEFGNFVKDALAISPTFSLFHFDSLKSNPPIMEIEYATLYTVADECLIKFKCSKFQLLKQSSDTKKPTFKEKGLKLHNDQCFNIIDVYLFKFYSESDIEEHKDLQYFYNKGGTWVKRTNVKHLSIDKKSFENFDSIDMFPIQKMTVSITLSNYNMNYHNNLLDYVERFLSLPPLNIFKIDIIVSLHFMPYNLLPNDEEIVSRVMALPITHFNFKSSRFKNKTQSEKIYEI
jgi:hypothetical protein